MTPVQQSEKTKTTPSFSAIKKFELKDFIRFSSPDLVEGAKAIEEYKKTPQFAQTVKENTQRLPKSLDDSYIQSRIAGVQDPTHTNPFAFTHELDRQAAVFAKAQRVVNDPEFQKMPEWRKNHLLNKLYDQYTVPIYEHAGMSAPNRQAWLEAVRTPGRWEVADFYEDSELWSGSKTRTFERAVDRVAPAALSQAGHIAHFLGQQIYLGGALVDRAQLGIANFFPGSMFQKQAVEQQAFDKKYLGAIIQKEQESSQSLIDQTTFWFDTHPSHSFTEKVGTFVGEQAVQLPMFKALGALRIAMSGQAIDAVGTIGKAANLTRALSTSKSGMFIARRLGAASDAYIGNFLSETKGDNTWANMAWYVGLDTVLGGVFERGPSRKAIKKQMAENLAAGGHVLNETIHDEAAHELEHNIIGTDANGQPIYGKPNDPEHFKAANEAAHAADPVKHNLVTAAKINLSAIARNLYGKPMNLISQAQRRKVRVEAIHMASEAKDELITHVPEVSQHEIQTQLQSDVRDNPTLAADVSAFEKEFGPLPYKIHVAESNTVARETGIKSPARAAKKSAQQAKKIAAPKTRAQQIFNDLSDKGNTKYNYRDESFDVKFQSPVDKNLFIISGREQRFSGWTPQRIASYDNAFKKLRRYFPGKSDAEIKQMALEVRAKLEGMVAARRADPTYKNQTHLDPTSLTFERMKEPPPDIQDMHAEKDTVERDYVQVRQNGLANFKNVGQSKKSTVKMKAANKQLAEFIEDMEPDEFAREVMEHMGDTIPFENDYHATMWGWHYRDQLPKPIQKKMLELLHARDPAGTVAKWDKEGKRLADHIDKLAFTGHLAKGETVFNTTLINGKKTVWQLDLDEEFSAAELANYQSSMQPFAEQFPREYEQGLAELTKFQTLRRQASRSPKKQETATQEIRKIIEKRGKYGDVPANFLDDDFEPAEGQLAAHHPYEHEEADYDERLDAIYDDPREYGDDY